MPTFPMERHEEHELYLKAVGKGIESERKRRAMSSCEMAIFLEIPHGRYLAHENGEVEIDEEIAGIFSKKLHINIAVLAVNSYLSDMSPMLGISEQFATEIVRAIALKDINCNEDLLVRAPIVLYCPYRRIRKVVYEKLIEALKRGVALNERILRVFASGCATDPSDEIRVGSNIYCELLRLINLHQPS